MINPKVLTPNGQILEAISAWAKIEMVEGMSQVPEPIASEPEEPYDMSERQADEFMAEEAECRRSRMQDLRRRNAVG